jgi:uracil-DNA glycosylase
MIVFVGDKPSSKNINPDMPFVGTPSYKVLTSWTMEMGVMSCVLINSRPEDEATLKIFTNSKVVALGNNASKVLTRLGLEHHKLPHPSPRNRVLNDKAKVTQLLADCKKWIEG